MAVLGLVAASALLASCELPGATTTTDDTATGAMVDTVSTGSSMGTGSDAVDTAE